MMLASNLENKIGNVEQFPVQVTFKSGRKVPCRSRVGDYTYQRAANGNWTLKRLITDRIKPQIGGEYSIEARWPDGREIGRNTRLHNIREAHAAVAV